MTSLQNLGIQNKNTHQTFFNAQNTGIAAAGCMALTGISAVSKTKSFRKHHKHFGLATVIATLLHVGVVIKHKIEKSNLSKNMN